MRYRLMGITATILVLAASFGASIIDKDNPTNRIHQHLEARAEDGSCSCDKSGLCTHLPIISIDTSGKEIPGDLIRTDIVGNEKYKYFTTAEDGSSDIVCKVKVVDSKTHNNHLTDEPSMDLTARIRIRGNSSRSYDKKGYLLNIKEEDGIENLDVPLLGMDDHHEWALHGPYLDKSLIRNYMWYNIAGEIMDYAPNVRFCEVVINGEYKGLYVMVETITNGEDSRLDMSKPEDGASAVSYVLRLDRGSTNPIKNIETFAIHTMRNKQKLDIVYPGASNLTPERIEYIRQDFSDFEKILYSFDYDTEPYAWWNEADMDSMVDYFIINEFTCNYDAGALSTYIYKDLRGKYKMCIWDFNSCCDNYNTSSIQPQRFQLQYVPWYYMLIKDEHFVNRVIERYEQLRETYLSDEYLMNYIDETVEWLGPAIDRNFEVWGYTFEEYTPLRPIERNPGNHDEAVEQMKDFIVERGDWMDEHIETLKQFCHESKIKKFNH